MPNKEIRVRGKLRDYFWIGARAEISLPIEKLAEQLTDKDYYNLQVAWAYKCLGEFDKQKLGNPQVKEGVYCSCVSPKPSLGNYQNGLKVCMNEGCKKYINTEEAKEDVRDKVVEIIREHRNSPMGNLTFTNLILSVISTQEPPQEKSGKPKIEELPCEILPFNHKKGNECILRIKQKINELIRNANKE